MVRRRLAAGVTRAVVGAVIGAATFLGAAATPATAGVRPLSDERAITRWATPTRPEVARATADAGARPVGRLRLQTEDRLPEVVLALQTGLDLAGREWVQVRLAGRPNGRTGWVPRGALGDFRLVRTQLRINRRTLRATLFDQGRPVFSAPIGIGRSQTPTPAGRYWVRERLTLGKKGGIYGPLAFGTAAYSRLSEWPGGGVIGIHGTNQPNLLPGRVSHGCVRMRNADILRLGRLMPIGTPINIL